MTTDRRARPVPADGAEVADGGEAAGRLDLAMGIEIVEAGPDRVVATMPVGGNTQPYGLLHGGATCVLAETVASIAATLYAGDGRVAVGVDINATHHRAMRSGTVTGVATPLHRGRTVATYDVAVTAEGGERVATARLTCQLIDAPGVAHAGLVPAAASGRPDLPERELPERSEPAG